MTRGPRHSRRVSRLTHVADTCSGSVCHNSILLARPPLPAIITVNYPSDISTRRLAPLYLYAHGDILLVFVVRAMVTVHSLYLLYSRVSFRFSYIRTRVYRGFLRMPASDSYRHCRHSQLEVYQVFPTFLSRSK